MKRILLLSQLVILINGLAHAQQTPLYSQYYLNPYLYNPSYAGRFGTQAFFQYRKQWVGVDGSPETQVFTLASKLKNEAWGIGLYFFNDVSNVIGRTNVALSASHTVQLASDQTLSFGMSGMLIQNKVFFDRVQVADGADPGLLNSMDDRTVFEMNAGLNYTWKKLNVGLAADQLLQSEIQYENAAMFQSLEYKYIRHYVTTASYKFDLNETLDLKPLILMRLVEGLSPKLDAGFVMGYKDIMWIGGSYRHQIGTGGSIGFFIDNRIVVGYSYEVPTSDLSTIGAGSHEFVIGLKFGQQSGYSKSGTSISQKYQQTRAVKNAVADQYEKMDQLEARNDQHEEKIAEYEELIDRQSQELQELRSLYESFQAEIEELKKGNAIVVREIQSNPSKGEHADIESEETQFYLVVGAFRKLENAKKFQRILKRDGETESRVIANNDQTWFLIYTDEVDSPLDASGRIEKIKDGPAGDLIIGDPWVFVKRSETFNESSK